MIAWSPAAPTRPACPHRRLRRLLARELPHGLALGASTLRPWASASFVGARHIFPCAFAVGDAEPLRQSLAAHLEAIEWRVAGHIVADIAVECDAESAMLRIEMLTVED